MTTAPKAPKKQAATKSLGKFDFSSKDAWKRPFKNAKKLLWGEMGKVIFTVGTMALTARALGVADFGALAILTTTLAIITQFVTFGSWQLVLRYGAEAFKENDSQAYKHVVGFALTLELVASAIGAILLWALADVIIAIFQLPESVSYVLPYLGILLIFTTLGGIADGTLRLTDRFNVISFINVLPKMLKFAIVVYLFMAHAGLEAFLYAMFITAGFSGIMRLSIALYYMKRDIAHLNQEAKDAVIAPKPRGKFFAPQQGVWKYAFGLYTDSCLGMGTQQLGTLFLGALVGPTGEGLYRIAEKISTMVAAPVNKLMLPAVFTDMAHLNAQKDYAATRRMVFKLGGAMGGAAALALIVLMFLGKPLLTLVAGAEFVPAYATMLILVFNIVMWSTTFTLYPLIMTSGKVRCIVYGRTVMFISYVGLMFPLIKYYGVEGAAAAAVISSFVATLISGYGAFKHAGLGLAKA